MDRRKFLIAGGGIFFTTGASGCLTDGGRDEDEKDPSGVDSLFSGDECPSFSDTRETRCYHKEGEQPDIYLAPEQEIGNPTEEPIEISLQRNSDSAVWSCPLSECWELHKLIEDEWYSLTPFREVPLVSEPLEAGNSHVWNVEMSNEVVSRRGLLKPEASELAYTGPGTYAFSVTLSMDEGGRDEVELVALFEVEGDTLEIEPTGIEDYERSDGTVHVQTGGEQSGAENNLVMSATRSDETVDVEPMLTEIAVQIAPVRNVLAFFDSDTQEVRLEGGRSLINRVEELRKAASVYEQKVGETLININEERSAGGYPYGFGFLYEGSYYEVTPEENDPS